MKPTAYKRPHVYKSNVYKRYGVNAGGIGVYKLPYGTPQEWTNVNVPEGLQTLHDFGDGLGPVPAIPVDRAGIDNEVTNVKVISHFGTDNASIENEVIGIKVISHFGTDNASIENEVIDVEEIV